MSASTHSPHDDPEPVVGRIVELMSEGIALAGGGDLPAALARFDAGLSIDPDFIPCRLARARLRERMGRFADALADEHHVLALAPLPELAAGAAALVERALASLAAVDDDAGADADACCERGRLYAQAGEPAAALADLDRALALDPGHAAARMVRAHVLYTLQRFPDAAADYGRILEADRGNALAWYNRGNALQKDRRLADALDAYARAVAVDPDFAEARLEQAHCLLAQGAFADGWRLYEWRWRTRQLARTQLATAQPRWLGETPLAGMTILLWAEQGFGDTIQFARFISLVADRARKVVVRVPPALRDLLATLDARVDVVAQGTELPPHDVHCPLMSLPLALGLGGDVAPAGTPYLRADPGLAAALLEDADARPRIGLCWAGRRTDAPGAPRAVNPGRDVPLEALAPLLAGDAAGVRFVSLQQVVSDAEAALLASLPNVEPPANGFASFADTAALIDAMDGVVTVDTAVAHLAGALGKPCWLMLRRAGEWRWNAACGTAGTEEASQWYPSMTPVRQTAEGEWDDVVRRVAEVLARRWPPAPAPAPTPAR